MALRIGPLIKPNILHNTLRSIHQGVQPPAFGFLDEAETQAEGQDYLPVKEYHYGYSYCDAHQSQSYQDVEGESVPAQPSDHAQVLQVESPCNSVV